MIKSRVSENQINSFKFVPNNFISWQGMCLWCATIKLSQSGRETGVGPVRYFQAAMLFEFVAGGPWGR